MGGAISCVKTNCTFDANDSVAGIKNGWKAFVFGRCALLGLLAPLLSWTG